MHGDHNHLTKESRGIIRFYHSGAKIAAMDLNPKRDSNIPWTEMEPAHNNMLIDEKILIDMTL
jgi:hypothetical protein